MRATVAVRFEHKILQIVKIFVKEQRRFWQEAVPKSQRVSQDIRK